MAMVETHVNLCEKHIIGRNTREWVVVHSSCQPLCQHQIFACGLSDAASPYRMARWKPIHLHILVCTGGEGRVLVGGAWLPCRAGQAYLSPVGAPMAFYPTPRKRWQFAWIYYERPLAEKLCQLPSCVLQPVDPTLFETSIRGLHREVQGSGDETVSASWVHLLHTATLRLLRPPAERFRLQSIWQEVEGKLAHPWNMALLARRAGLSEEHLRRLSWKETGRSPIKHIAFLRIQRAALLLQTTPLKVAAVAHAVGYEDPFAFSTAFKRFMGFSPSAYSRNQAKAAPLEI